MKTKYFDFASRFPGAGLFFTPEEISPAQVSPDECCPEDIGLSQEAANKVLAAFEALFHSGVYPGMSFCVRYRGKILFNRAWGYARLEEGEQAAHELTLDTPICLFSASKAISAMLIHKLAEQGLIELLNPVATYLPEFAQNGKERITIYHLLTHRAGVPNVVTEGIPSEVLLDADAVYKLICGAQPLSPDGRITAYHAVTSGFVIAKLIEKLTGKTVGEYLDEVIRKPMGMKYFTYGVEPQYKSVVAHNYAGGFKNGRLISAILDNAFGVSIAEGIEMSNMDSFLDVAVPSGNLFATAEEAGRFFQMLLDDGIYQDKQVFEPLSILRATQESGRAILDRNVYLPMRYSPGFMLGGKPVGIWGANSHQAFGHIGFSNILCWADPARELSVAVLTTGKPVLGRHILALPRLMHSMGSQFPARDS